MRTYDQLSAEEQQKAQGKALARLLQDIIEGSLAFDDELNHDDLQARIDKAIEKAQAMQTPWFAHEYILDDAFVKETLESIAICDAEDAFYLEANEQEANEDGTFKGVAYRHN